MSETTCPRCKERQVVMVYGDHRKLCPPCRQALYKEGWFPTRYPPRPRGVIIPLP